MSYARVLWWKCREKVGLDLAYQARLHRAVGTFQYPEPLLPGSLGYPFTVKL